MKKHLLKLSFLLLVVMLAVCLFAVSASADAGVAKIGDTDYAGFGAAWSAAKDGDTIKLTADATIEGTLPLQGSEQAPVSVTVDLNGHTLSAKAGAEAYFNVKSYASLRIVGAGTIATAGKPFLVVDAGLTGTSVTIGEKNSTNRILVHDYEGRTAGAQPLLQVRSGSFDVYHADFIYFCVASGKAMNFQNGDVIITMDDSSVLMSAPGWQTMMAFDGSSKVRFEATNCVFNQPTFEADEASSDKQNGAATCFAFPTAMTDAESYFRMIDSKLTFRWRCFVNSGGADYEAGILPVELTRCEITMGFGDHKYSADRQFSRRMSMIFTDCKFDDTNMKQNAGDFVGWNSTATFKGDNQSKYGLMYIPTDNAAIKVDEGFGKYFFKDASDGYPYHYTAEDVTGKVNEDNIVYCRVLIGAGQDFSVPFSAGQGQWLTLSNSSIYFLAKVGKAENAANNLAEMQTVVTAASTNRYMRFYALVDTNPTDANDAYFNIYGGKKSNYVDVKDYEYYTLDFDMTTESQYQDYMNFVNICRDQNESGFPMSNRDIFLIRVESTGEHAGEAYIQSRIGADASGNAKVYLGKDPYVWHHITVAYRFVSYEEKDGYNALTKALAVLYVDGKRVNATPATMNPASVDCVIFGQNFRLQYLGGSTTANAGDTTCFDNIVIRAFKRGQSDEMAPLFDNASLTLASAGYIGYGENYETPAVEPVAQVLGVGFETLKEAYDYAAAHGINTITLLRDTKEQIDIKANIRLYVGSIDYVPTDASWGFSRGEDANGAYYEFSAALDAGALTYWYSNPFDENYAYEYPVKGGRYIAHPVADKNNALLQKYAVKNADGSYSFYRFIGWSATQGSTVPVTNFPLITSANVSENFVYYPVYEKCNVLYLYDTTVVLEYANEDFEVYTKETAIYTGGTSLSDLRAFVQTSGQKNAVLCDDITVNENVGALFNVQGTLDLDLNGHKISYVIYSAATASSSVSKQNVFNIVGGSTLNITSSQPGAVIEGRTVAYNMTGDSIINNATGIFNCGTNINLTVTGSNVTIRGGIIEEASNTGATILFDGCVIHQVCADSWGAFMIRSTGVISFTLRDVLFINTVKTTTGGLLQKDLFDVGQGSAVQKVDIKIENCRFYWSQNTGDSGTWLTARFPAGATLEISGTVGNYCPGTSQTGTSYAGVIKVGANNSFARAIDSSANYAQTQFEDGVVCARKWAFFDIRDLYPDGFQVSYIHESGANSSTPKAYEDYATQWTVAGYLSNVKFRWGSFNREDTVLVIWNPTTDVNSKVLSQCLWYKTESNPFYSNWVPAYTDANGFTYSYPNDSWKKYATAADGLTVYFAPDPAKAMLSGANISGYKQNVLLYTEMAMNLFVPETAYPTTVSVGGVALPSEERTVDGQKYFVFRVAVDADGAANEIAFNVTFTSGANSATQVVKTSLAAYAQKLSTFENGAYADLAAAMLLYAKAAYVYTAGAEAEIPEALNIAGAQIHAEMPAAVASIAAQETVLGVQIALGPKPVYVVAVNKEFSGTITVRYQGVSGRDYEMKKVVEPTENEVNYVSFDSMKLYDFGATFTVLVNGESIGRYNLGAYFNSLDENQAAAKSVLIALVDYMAAAKDYIYGD